jgi:hypothetical protein
MADTETILRRKKMEQLLKMKEWDAICPDNAFVDADVKEEITGRHFKDTNTDFTRGASSLEQ